MKFKKLLLIISICIVSLVGIGWVNRTQIMRYLFAPTAAVTPEWKGAETAEILQDGNTTQTTQVKQQPEVVAENLQIPWEVAFLPAGELLVTERPGTLLHITADARQAIPVQGVYHRGEGGLLGMALHPDFAQNRWVYLYATTQVAGQVTNRVERYEFDSSTHQLAQRTVILDNIPGSSNHDGGRIEFGPDDYLYVATGDAEDSQNAQDTNSLAGKILRLQADGSIPADNPFGNAVYSYGHRNPQGLAWDERGRLWATEHGPSGPGTGYDEVNLIEKGANYGWPTIQGTKTAANMKTPIIQSGGSETWAPAGMFVSDGVLYFVGLRGASLYSAQITETGLEGLSRRWSGTYGRLRVARVSPDGWLYFATSNTDGRGTPQSGDDKLYRVQLSSLK